MKKNTTKRSLLASLLALVMCVTMLVGTTFAWFTDSASTSVNKIEAGRLKVDIVDAGNTDTSLKGGEMSFVNKDNSANILWEPGATFKTPAFRIKNAGNLALKYKLALNGVTGDNELLDVIKFSVVKADGTEVDLDSFEGHLTQAAPLSDALYIQGYMDKEASNHYQGMILEGIGITVYAAQDTVENDSRNNLYDENAEYPVMIDSKTSGTAAAGSGDTGSKNSFEEALTADKENIEIVLTGDAVYDLDGYTLPLGGENTKTITIIGNGNKVIFNKLNLNLSQINCNGAKLVIKNATVAIGTDRATSPSWDAHDILFKGDVAFENVTFERAVAINGNASFKNCTISDKNAKAETYMLWIQAGSNVTLDNCTIDGKSNTTHGNRAIAIKDQYVANAGMTTLTINGGKISSDKKAAVIVSTLGGANITVTGTVDITGVAKDQTNLVWKDSGSNPDNGIAYSTAYDKITVRGASCIVEP